MSTAKAPSFAFKPCKESVYRVILADDHGVFRLGLKDLLKHFRYIKVVDEVSNGKKLTKLIEQLGVDIIFMDLNMPGGHGGEATAKILAEYPHIKIIVLSSYNDALTVERMMKMGAAAYLTKNITKYVLQKMFEKVLNNEVYLSDDAEKTSQPKKPAVSLANSKTQKWLEEELSDREKEILTHTVGGLSMKEMAKALKISTRTVEFHKENLMLKLNAQSTAELIAIAYKFNLVKF